MSRKFYLLSLITITLYLTPANTNSADTQTNSNEFRLLEASHQKLGNVEITNNIEGFKDESRVRISNLIHSRHPKQRDGQASEQQSARSDAADEAEVQAFKAQLLDNQAILLSTPNNCANFARASLQLSAKDKEQVHSLTLDFNNSAASFPGATLPVFAFPAVRTLHVQQLAGPFALLASIAAQKPLLSHLSLSHLGVPSEAALRFTDEVDAFFASLHASRAALTSFALLRSPLPKPFFAAFRRNAPLFSSLQEVTFGASLSDALLPEAFSELSAVEKYYLPKNALTDVGFASLLEIVKAQVVSSKGKVVPFVVDLAYNSVAMQAGKVYDLLGEVGEVAGLGKERGFTVEIYENPLRWDANRKAELEEKFGMLFNDFDNELEWEDL